MSLAEPGLSPEEIHLASLAVGLARVEQALHAHITRSGGTPPAADLLAPGSGGELPPGVSSALDVVCAVFHLSPFERDVLLLCAAVELDARFPELCAAAQGNSQLTAPTFSLALAALEGADWGALTPHAPLRYWRLVEVSAGAHLTQSPLRIDERILHLLTGIDQLDIRLDALVEPVPSTVLSPSQVAVMDHLHALWSGPIGPEALPIIQLCGDDEAAQRAVAAAACARQDLLLYALPAEAVPTGAAELEEVIRLWTREALITNGALLVECREMESAGTPRADAVTRLLERIGGAVLVSARDRRPSHRRPMVTFEVARPTVTEQRALWTRSLGREGTALDGAGGRLAAQFDVDERTLQECALQALSTAGSAGTEELSPAQSAEIAAWEACRTRTRPRLEDLAQRIESGAGWDDLVLPESQKAVLRDIVGHVRQRHQVYHEWGFAARGARGLGISAMFAGDSGTGKTMAAEVLANELRLDLYRVDLSAAVSKYIGETEKNLRRIFDAAEGGGAILLFDEADALFGKRSDVKDSHDRFANVQVSYLLQRMECYRGLAVLTTNYRSALDPAFLRRIRFDVQFPFPDAAQRAEIWRRAFPPAVPTEGLAPEKLARLNVAGGNIRNIVLNAAFLAAGADEPVRMGHVLRATRAEYGKLEKTLTDAETAGWL